MYDPVLLADRGAPLSAPPSLAPDMVGSLRELVRSGYAVDADAAGQGLRLRHKAAPDLILFEDGTLALAPSARKPKDRKDRRAGRAQTPRRIHWRRTFGVAFVATAAWSLSVLLGVSLLSG